MDSYKELMDSIAILVDKAADNSTKIVFGIVNSATDINCVITYAGVEHTLKYHGNTPTVNKRYPIFIPNGNMSQAFVLGDAGSGSGLVPVTPEDNGKILGVKNGQIAVGNPSFAMSSNLHNSSTDIPNVYLSNTDGQEVSYNGWSATDFIPIETGAYYVLSATSTYCALYDENKNFLLSNPPANGVYAANVKYIRASFAVSQTTSWSITKLMLAF